MINNYTFYFILILKPILTGLNLQILLLSNVRNVRTKYDCKFTQIPLNQ